MAIDINKKYKTRDGREVRIYAVDCGGHYPVHAATKGGDGWSVNKWASNGRYNTGVVASPSDLIEVKPTVKVDLWLNVDREGNAHVYSSRHYADKGSEYGRFACIHIEREVEHGEGL